MLGIIGGTSLLFTRLPDLERRVIHTPFGNSELLCGRCALLLRHQQNRPPHRINFRSHLASLALCGVTRLVTIGSAGSLKGEIPPGSIVIPSDYISMTSIPSIHDNAIRHVHPGFSAGFSRQLAAVIPEARCGGVYVQTPGPRIETKAEVRLLAAGADIVGMTIASEATLARELGMEIAALCTVDNYANGLSDEVLTYEHILKCAEENKDRTGAMVERIIGGLA
ncbi:MAG: MTAP family purine nucleoside phosphorylase [Methanoregulaceae archaeon]|nr:MTAP family purine nucleoside phosphorylase [Methanoregulaceae archaeon]